MNWYDNQISIPAKIQRSLSLVSKYKDEIAEKQLCIDALEDQMTDLVNSICLIVSERMMDTAFHQQHKKKKSERSMYEAVKEVLLENFFSDVPSTDVRLTQIMCGGYAGYYYAFEFEVRNCKLSLRIPSTGNIQKENLSACNYGQYVLYHDDNAYLRCIKRSYDVKVIAKAIEEFMKEREKSNEEVS